MRRKICILAAALMLTLSMQAQSPRFNTGRRTDVRLERILDGATSLSRRIQACNTDMQSLIINADDADRLANELKSNGYEAMAISENVLTATLPVAAIRKLKASDKIRYIRTPRKFRLNMDKTRAVTNASQVHSGAGLDTPFNGEGVIVGVIDQCFEYRHAAFLDENGKSRVKQLWCGGTSEPTEEIPDDWDGYEYSDGHATHTTNIAAGSDTGNGLYGMAPKADIYMMPSSLEENEILQGLKYLSDYSKSQGKPCVVNMSFGSQLGPHDGTTEFDQTADKILGHRFIACAAMGNEGNDYIHSMHSFTASNQMRNVVFNLPLYYNEIYEDSYEKVIYGIAVCTAADGEKHLTFRPFVLSNGQKIYPTEEQLNSFVDLDFTYEEINPFSGHHQYCFMILGQRMLRTMGFRRAQFGIEITGNEGDVVHVWLEPEYGTIGSPSGVTDTSEYMKYSKNFCVSEASSSIPQAIAVAAVDGSTMNLASFSSLGPWLGNERKPTVAAPGISVSSAICKYVPDFDDQKSSATSVTINGNTYYYGAKSGTSMATPVVTGIVALWLQAYPDMSHDELLEIIRTTSQHSEYNPDEWDECYGYGVIDAYAGLKKSLELARVSRINECFNTEQPVTIKTQGRECRLLFNNDETFAEVILVSAAGKRVFSRTVSEPRRGDEQSVSLKDLSPGVYVLSIRTTSQLKSSKVLVR